MSKVKCDVLANLLDTDEQDVDDIISRTDRYVSPAQSVGVGNTGTLAHGLNGIPTQIAIVAKCLTAEFGWSVGDEIIFNPGRIGNTGGIAIQVDDTNLYYHMASTASVVLDYSYKTGGGLVGLTSANWEVYIHAML